MKVFEYRNYKEFLKSWLKEQPKSGRGQLKKIAEQGNGKERLQK